MSTALPPLQVDDEVLAESLVIVDEVVCKIEMSFSTSILGLVPDDLCAAMWGTEEYRKDHLPHVVYRPGAFDPALPPDLEQRVLDAVRNSLSPALVAEVHAHYQARYQAAVTDLCGQLTGVGA
jgi:hypothetical protein